MRRSKEVELKIDDVMKMNWEKFWRRNLERITYLYFVIICAIGVGLVVIWFA